MPLWLVIGISGVTCGGKTTLAHVVADYLRSTPSQRLWNGPYVCNDVHLISQDDYFLPVDDPRQKWNERLNVVNYELLSSLDMKQMLEDIKWLMRGGSGKRQHHPGGAKGDVHMDNNNMEYKNQHSKMASGREQNFAKTQRFGGQSSSSAMGSKTGGGHTIMRGGGGGGASAAMPPPDNKINVLILEGFILFSQPELLALCHMKFHLHIPYEKCYARRLLRTYDPPDITGYFEVCVWPQYEKYVASVQQHKDIRFLNGEIPIPQMLKYFVSCIGKFMEKPHEVSEYPPPSKMKSRSKQRQVQFMQAVQQYNNHQRNIIVDPGQSSSGTDISL